MSGFAASVGAWCHGVVGAIEAIHEDSVTDVVSVMQTAGPSKAATKADIKNAKKKFVGPPQPAGHGGRMPVDTGHLRASLMASTSQMPSIDPNNNNPTGQPVTYQPGQVETVIKGATLGQTIYIGYTAAYAAAMEYGSGSLAPYAFVRTAAQGWQQIVAKNEAAIMRARGLS
ncbi:HK97 gp10 family phage protein [Ancylobacter sp.]|uniref:HK97 gp10 family phage protein n=1 Tax=Ancylobacter sp. TaxID=1872567 RepID=UPI003D0EF450